MLHLVSKFYCLSFLSSLCMPFSLFDVLVVVVLCASPLFGVCCAAMLKEEIDGNAACNKSIKMSL